MLCIDKIHDIHLLVSNCHIGLQYILSNNGFDWTTQINKAFSPEINLVNGPNPKWVQFVESDIEMGITAELSRTETRMMCHFLLIVGCPSLK